MSADRTMAFRIIVSQPISLRLSGILDILHENTYFT
jgi:hypothetical protein